MTTNVEELQKRLWKLERIIALLVEKHPTIQKKVVNIVENEEPNLPPGVREAIQKLR